MEIWKSVKNYEGLYEVSNLGRVKSLTRRVFHGKSVLKTVKGRILKSRFNEKGYVKLALCKNGTTKNVRLSRLVAEHFIPNQEGKPEVNHKNGIKTDNSAQNLEWVTRLENQHHAMTTLSYNPKLSPRDRGQSPIACFSKTGLLVKKYPSINEASRELNVFRSSISRSIKHPRKLTGGFLWKKV